MTPPTAEGGALRSQDVRTTGDPTASTARSCASNPDTGAAMPGNPNTGSSDPNARRIVAHGLRNPFRITVRPGTNEVWAGDVGWNAWEEINRVPTPTSEVANFGWPCYEGTGRMGGYDNLNLNICETSTRRAPAPTPPRTTRTTTRRASSRARPAAIGSLVDLGPGLQPAGRQLPGRLQRRAVLLRLQPRLHLGDARAAANGLPDPANRQTFVVRRRQAGRAPVRPGRRPLLRRPRRRHDPARPRARARTARRSRAPRRRRPGRGAAHRHVRRHDLERPGRVADHLRLGPRRRRRLRRLDRRPRRASPTR